MRDKTRSIDPVGASRSHDIPIGMMFSPGPRAPGTGIRYGGGGIPAYAQSTLFSPDLKALLFRYRKTLMQDAAGL